MEHPAIIIENVNIIDNNELIKDQTIHISNGIISNISQDTTQNSSMGKNKLIRINGKDNYVSPGLIDNHVHLILNGSNDIINYVNTSDYNNYLNVVKQNITQSIRNGITSIVDMGDTKKILSNLKKNKENTKSLNPNIFLAGQMISTKKGHVKNIAREIEFTKKDINNEIENQLNQDVDFFKIIVSGGLLTKNSYPLKTELNKNHLSLFCKLAKEKQIPIAAHAYSDNDIANAINAGVSRIEHGIYASNKTLHMASKKGIIFTPTLKAAFDIIDHKDCLPHYMSSHANEILDQAKFFIKNVKINRIKIAMGTDAGTPFNFHGDNTKELELLVEYGLTNAEAIESATTTAAQSIGMHHALGRIKSGYIADILLLDKNPLDDITAYQHNIKQVISKGKLVKQID